MPEQSFPITRADVKAMRESKERQFRSSFYHQATDELRRTIMHAIDDTKKTHVVYKMPYSDDIVMVRSLKDKVVDYMKVLFPDFEFSYSEDECSTGLSAPISHQATYGFIMARWE
jgi:hypothetical protein